MTKARTRSSTEAKLWRAIDEALEEWIAAGLVIETGWQGRPLFLTPLPTKGVRFDAAAVEKVLRFFALLRHQKGRWAGQKFVLLDWQVRYELAPVFGLKRADGTRAIRTAWLEKPRKNGKSTECSGIGLYLFAADGEPGAEVYAAAGDRPQATIVFGAAKRMAAGSAPLRRRLGRGLRVAVLEHPRTHAIFRALSSDGARQHGLNVHGAIIDEVHVHKNPDLIEALETGTGSRDQPLVVFITTADAGVVGCVYATKRDYLEGICAGHIVDATFYGVVFGVDETVDGFDPFADATLVAANPGVGFTTSLEYLRQAATKASQSAPELNSYLRLHLNIRTKQDVKWLTLVQWDRAAGMADVKAWKGAVVRGGLDLSTSIDLTSFVLVRPNVGGLEAGCHVWPMFWLPEERIVELELRCQMPLRQWAGEGWLRLTEGNVVDYAKVRADIVAEIGRLGCEVASIGYDPWNATETVQVLQDQHGLVMSPVQQNYGRLSASCKQLERLVVGSTSQRPLFIHGGHPILRWNADCVAVRQDDNGNIKPVKPDRYKSGKRIDGIVAAIMAIREVMMGEVEEGSAAQAALDAMIAAKGGR